MDVWLINKFAKILLKILSVTEKELSTFRGNSFLLKPMDHNKGIQIVILKRMIPTKQCHRAKKWEKLGQQLLSLPEFRGAELSENIAQVGIHNPPSPIPLPFLSYTWTSLYSHLPLSYSLSYLVILSPSNSCLPLESTSCPHLFNFLCTQHRVWKATNNQ